VQPGKVEEVVKVILSELARVASAPVEAKELQKAKEYMKGKTTLALEDNQVRLDWYLEQVAFKKRVLTPQEAFARIDAVTAAQVQRVAEEIFVSKQLSLVVVGPHKDKSLPKSLEKIVKF
jgi:predicted Zn-dependent peptidase